MHISQNDSLNVRNVKCVRTTRMRLNAPRAPAVRVGKGTIEVRSRDSGREAKTLVAGRPDVGGDVGGVELNGAEGETARKGRGQGSVLGCRFRERDLDRGSGGDGKANDLRLGGGLGGAAVMAGQYGRRQKGTEGQRQRSRNSVFVWVPMQPRREIRGFGTVVQRLEREASSWRYQPPPKSTPAEGGELLSSSSFCNLFSLHRLPSSICPGRHSPSPLCP